MAKLNEKVEELKKNLILDVASTYFKDFGYEKTQIEKISKDLSIGVGTIYGFFKSKEGLFLAWLASVINEAYDEILKTTEGISSPIEKLTKIAEYKIKYFEKNKTTIKGYMENNQLFLRGISRRKEHPMDCVYTFCASIIREIKQMSEETSYLLANIFDSMINCYIECASSDEDLFSKKDEMVHRFLCMLEVKNEA